MKIEFDSEADALYIEFHDGQVYDCLAVTEGVKVDAVMSGIVFAKDEFFPQNLPHLSAFNTGR